MGYVPLNNYNYDSGYRRIQSGPNHQGFIVLTSGYSAYGVNEGIVVPGSPLSGSPAGGTWDYDSNWRYVPPTLPNQSGSVDPTPYNASGALDTYNAARIYTRDNVAGAQAASAIGPETGKINPRGGALQPRANVTRPEKYMYFGGGAPDNQDYSPYNTPDANTAAEGKTGGGVTHRNYESSLLTNLLGSQGTSDRSQWRYHQPVYCKTFTETQRSTTPGLMSSPLRYVYRGQATSYNYNYGGELLASKGGFNLLNYEEFSGGCSIPPGCPIRTGPYTNPASGDLLTAQVYCQYDKIEWFNTSGTVSIGSGETYTLQTSDYNTNVFYTVTYPNGSTASSTLDCLPPVDPYASWPSGVLTPNDPIWPTSWTNTTDENAPNYVRPLPLASGEVYERDPSLEYRGVVPPYFIYFYGTFFGGQFCNPADDFTTLGGGGSTFWRASPIVGIYMISSPGLCGGIRAVSIQALFEDGYTDPCGGFSNAGGAVPSGAIEPRIETRLP